MSRQIKVLEELYTSTLEAVALLLKACAAPIPDFGHLNRARHGLMSVSLKRSKFLQAEVYPALMAASASRFEPKIDALDKDLAAKRAVTNQHISRWSPAEIKQDWSAYQSAVTKITKGVEARVTLERSMILPALREISASQVTMRDAAA